MEYNNLLELIKTVSESNISGFQYEDGDTKIVISTGENPLPGCVTNSNTGASDLGNVQEKSTITKDNTLELQNNKSQALNAENKEQFKNIVKSPLVGTFYAAPAEDAQVFVQVGDRVKKGQTLAIVEAMKLMNDIESEYDGVVEQVFVNNGDMVEYGQPLFAIA